MNVIPPKRSEDKAICPHCNVVTETPMNIQSCNIMFVCIMCKGIYRIYIDEDIDCNYWFGVEKA